MSGLILVHLHCTMIPDLTVIMSYPCMATPYPPLMNKLHHYVNCTRLVKAMSDEKVVQVGSGLSTTLDFNLATYWLCHYLSSSSLIYCRSPSIAFF